MTRPSRRALVGGLTAVGGLLVAGSVRVIAQAPALVVRRDIKDLQERFPDELAKFAEAVKALRAKTVNGISGWDFNADAHRIYCARDTQEVHGTWWFLPWHRAYLHATERNLQIALGDKTVALPYWHWPITPGVPASYRTGPLAHERFGENDALPPFMLDLTGMAAPSYRGRVLDGVLVEPSFGGNSAAPNAKTRTAIEGTPHGSVHNAVGSFLKNANGQPVDRNGNVVPPEQAISGDMRILARAAHDPIFFAHHANIDRLWEVWRTPPDSAHAKSEPWDMPDFANPPFPFNFLDLASPTAPFAVKVASVRNTSDLHYRYAAPGEGPTTVATSMVVAENRRAEPDGASLGSQTRRSSVPVTPPLPSPMASSGAPRTILSLTGVEIGALGLDVAVYLTEKDTTTFTPADGVYAGLLSVVSTGQGPTRENLALDVTEAMERLKPTGTNVHVVLVPIKPATGTYQPSAPAVERFELRKF